LGFDYWRCSWIKQAALEPAALGQGAPPAVTVKAVPFGR
jgi:hypothetical protein